MIFRVMEENDYQGVYDLWTNTPGMGLNTTDDSEEGYKKYLKRNPSTSFVALDGNKIAGVIMAGHDGRRGYIYHTAVLPEYRGNYIGKKLVDLAMSALEKEGINKVALVVYENNKIGNKFWESQGFTTRDDLIYRNKNIHQLNRIDT
jgi:ribosomal protein S18 acetylase RimI-like enzyme